MMSSIEQTGAPVDLRSPTPRVLEPFDAVWREDEVNVERAVLQLDEVFAAPDLGGLLGCQFKAQLLQGMDRGGPIAWRLLHVEVGVLCGVGKAVEDRSRLAQEQVGDAVPLQGVS